MSQLEIRIWLLGAKFEEYKPLEFYENTDRSGWNKGIDDKWHFAMVIQNGKIMDWSNPQPKSGLKELVNDPKVDLKEINALSFEI
jgi:sulfite reductase (NADPH) hemoprotein beta-component